jgi:hypothetical protein
MQHEYRDGTLREKLYGLGRNRLALPHPAAQVRESVWGTVAAKA